jgi:hypothetical protein
MKKSTLGPPIPMLMIEMGTALYRPVMVMKPRSDDNVNSFGVTSRKDAILWARDAEPTVTCKKNFTP